MRGAWVIHNPAAGRFPAESQVRRAADVFTSAGWSVHFETAARRDHLHDLVLRAADSGADVLVVAGGDGTVGLAASLPRGSEPAPGWMPAASIGSSLAGASTRCFRPRSTPSTRCAAPTDGMGWISR